MTHTYAAPNGRTVIKVWLDKSFIYHNQSLTGNQISNTFDSPKASRYFFDNIFQMGASPTIGSHPNQHQGAQKCQLFPESVHLSLYQTGDLGYPACSMDTNKKVLVLFFFLTFRLSCKQACLLVVRSVFQLSRYFIQHVYTLDHTNVQ